MQSFLVRVVNPQPVKKPRSTTDLACGKTKQNSAQNNKTKAGPVQTYLDLGQKSLGKTHACKICGMTYVVDVDDDVDSHVKFCKSVNSVCIRFKMLVPSLFMQSLAVLYRRPSCQTYPPQRLTWWLGLSRTEATPSCKSPWRSCFTARLSNTLWPWWCRTSDAAKSW
jgi:hypothetical protein